MLTFVLAASLVGDTPTHILGFADEQVELRTSPTDTQPRVEHRCNLPHPLAIQDNQISYFWVDIGDERVVIDAAVTITGQPGAARAITASVGDGSQEMLGSRAMNADGGLQGELDYTCKPAEPKIQEG